MSKPITLDIISDDDDDEKQREIDLSTPLPTHTKRQKTEPKINPTIFVIDDDPTPQKSVGLVSTPSFVAETPLSSLFVPETPMSTLLRCDVPLVKCTNIPPEFQIRSSSASGDKFTGVSGLICLESDNESENGCREDYIEQNETLIDMTIDPEFSCRYGESTSSMGKVNSSQVSDDTSSHPVFSRYDFPQVNNLSDEEFDRQEPMDKVLKPKARGKVDANKKKNMDEADGKKKMTKDERIRLMEEKKQQKEQEKLQKAALKAEAEEMKKLQKEKQKWEKGKFALKSIVAEIDTKVVELGSVGGNLLTRFAEKGLSYRIVSNPIERSIVWTMNVPEEISQLSSSGIEIPYVLLIYEAEEFCDLVTNDQVMNHVSSVRSRYPFHTICYLTNKLMAYINRREQAQYKKSGTESSGWRRPPVEEALSTLTTHFIRVHSRQCIDEAEIAEHVVGLTCSLASCQFRKKLTRLSVNANGSLIPKDCVDKNLIKKSPWLKALVSIPKVQPRFALAIWKKYPTMKSLLSVYMDPSKPVHEKEFLLKELRTEGLLSEDRRLGEVCSKRVYRILMAQSGTIKTDDVEDGADFFTRQQSI